MLIWDSFQASSGIKQLVADVDPTLRVTEQPLHLRYELGEELGTGSFGRAVKAVRLEDDETVVIKQIRLLDLDEKARQEALLEVKVLSTFDHINIIKYDEAILEVGQAAREHTVFGLLQPHPACMHACGAWRPACVMLARGVSL